MWSSTQFWFCVIKKLDLQSVPYSTGTVHVHPLLNGRSPPTAPPVSIQDCTDPLLVGFAAPFPKCIRFHRASMQWRHLGWGHFEYSLPRHTIQHSVKNVPDRFQEWLTEIVRHSAILGWADEHFLSGSPNLAGMFLHNSLQSGDMKRRPGNGIEGAMVCTS